MSEVFLVDTHVHIRSCFPRPDFFDVASGNFARSAERIGEPGATGVLILTESATEDAFRELEKLAGFPLEQWGGWSARRTGDDCSLSMERGDCRLLLIAGRQVDTSERLEVSILGSSSPIPDHTPVREVLAISRDRGCLSVIPWAPGKWSFARGRLLDDLMDHSEKERFCLGDNGGRPWLWPTPSHIRRAYKQGMPVLRGSDPLPFDSEMHRTGTFGMVLRGKLDRQLPGESIQEMLRDDAPKAIGYGQLANPVAFLWRESWMQITKRRRKSAEPARHGHNGPPLT